MFSSIAEDSESTVTTIPTTAPSGGVGDFVLSSLPASSTSVLTSGYQFRGTVRSLSTMNANATSQTPRGDLALQASMMSRSQSSSSEGPSDNMSLSRSNSLAIASTVIGNRKASQIGDVIRVEEARPRGVFAGGKWSTSESRIAHSVDAVHSSSVSVRQLQPTSETESLSGRRVLRVVDTNDDYHFIPGTTTMTMTDNIEDHDNTDGRIIVDRNSNHYLPKRSSLASLGSSIESDPGSLIYQSSQGHHPVLSNSSVQVPRYGGRLEGFYVDLEKEKQQISQNAEFAGTAYPYAIFKYEIDDKEKEKASNQNRSSLHVKQEREREQQYDDSSEYGY